ncbi:MAG: hypothetical protein HY925_13525 [Elusimicrobia bacterium]|nr:hypothetical protein [Elusimicrobiota bacterium]
MRSRFLLLLVLAAAFSGGCRHIPYLKKFVKPDYYPYLASKLYSFEYKRKWGDPHKTEHGVEVRSPDGTGSWTLEFLPEKDKDFKPVDKYRRDMAVWGSTEDSHVVKNVVFSSRTAVQIQFTHYEYDQNYLVGERVHVQTVNVTAVPDPRGMFIITYRAPREEFWNRKTRKEYDRWLQTLVLSYPPEEKPRR